MVIDRRTLIGIFGAGLASMALPDALLARGRELFAAARKEQDGSFSAVLFDETGKDILRVALPARGHDIAVRPHARECVVFARRPGTFAIAFGPAREQPYLFAAQKGRHFYGHGVFSPDGKLLYTSENDIETGEGIIGVRDAGAGYKPVGAYPSGGTGPHDILLAMDGRTLIVANGGIRTHPDFGRKPLNLASMRPDLSYIDRATGDLLEQISLPKELHQLSIRHLALAGANSVVFGAQHKGARSEQPALIGTHRRGEDIQTLGLGNEAYGSLRNYVTSIAADETGEHAVATSAPGSTAMVVSLKRERVLALHRLGDVSGVAAMSSRDGFVVTSGTGALSRLGREETDVHALSGETRWHWDNHAVRVGVWPGGHT